MHGCFVDLHTKCLVLWKFPSESPYCHEISLLPIILVQLQYHINLYKIDGSATSKIFAVPKFDRCRFLDKKSKAHPVMKVILALLKSLFSNSLKCPFTGTYAIKDFSLDHQSLSILPRGVIRFTFQATTDVDDLFVFVSVLFEIEN